jgi:hypothetical protein
LFAVILVGISSEKARKICPEPVTTPPGLLIVKAVKSGKIQG